MSELTPKPSANGTSGTDGFNGSTVTTVHPQIDHTAQRVKDATAEGIDQLAGVISTALTQFDRRAEQLRNLHANVSEQARGAVRQHPVITIGMTFVAGMRLEQLTRD